MRTRPGFWIHFHTFTALAAAALFGTTAEAADLGLEPLPPLTAPVESWTGFSFALGGGLGILTADVNGRASRTDTFGFCPGAGGGPDCPNGFTPFPDPAAFISQSHQLNIQDLSGDGIFGTIQAAYDWQIASRWVGGLFVDADLYDINGHAKQRSSVSSSEVDFLNNVGNALPNNFDFTLGDATLNAKVGIDWSLSVGGRFGYLATPDVLLYVLGAYTHAELENTRFEVNITDPAHPTDNSGLSPINTHYLFKLANDVDGFTLGAGSEVKLGGGWSLKGEYRFTWLDGEARRASSQEVQCCGAQNAAADIARQVEDNAAIDMDFDIHTVRGMLAYRF